MWYHAREPFLELLGDMDDGCRGLGVVDLDVEDLAPTRGMVRGCKILCQWQKISDLGVASIVGRGGAAVEKSCCFK